MESYKISSVQKVPIRFCLEKDEAEPCVFEFLVTLDDWALVQRIRNAQKAEIYNDERDIDRLDDIRGLFEVMAPGQWDRLYAYCEGSISNIGLAVLAIGQAVVKKLSETKAERIAPKPVKSGEEL